MNLERIFRTVRLLHSRGRPCASPTCLKRQEAAEQIVAASIGGIDDGVDEIVVAIATYPYVAGNSVEDDRTIYVILAENCSEKEGTAPYS